jgi:alpha-aminoadipic semialdehyde synthase
LEKEINLHTRFTMLRFAGRHTSSLLCKSNTAGISCHHRFLKNHHRRSLTVAILRETYDKWERRAPLSPQQVAAFLHQQQQQQQHGDTTTSTTTTTTATTTTTTTTKVLVQPSSHRIFSDQEYREAGATIQQDVQDANVILAVKRPQSLKGLPSSSTYLFFSHVRKGQPENMELLQECLNHKVQLIDYECITTKDAESGKSKRLVAFGKYAGMAGMLDTFSILGRRLLGTYGMTTPFLNCPPAIYHANIQEAKDAVRRLGEAITTRGLLPFEPIVVCVTGTGGNVHGGVREILDLVPHQMVRVGDLPDLLASGSSSSSHQQIYVVAPELKDMYERKGGGVFDREDFNQNPDHYTCSFAETVAPYCHVLINGIYWDHRFPRILTKEDMLHLYDSGNER